MALTQSEITAKLHSLEGEAEDLRDLSIVMLKEYVINGNDSLAMIDYGAAFNTIMRNIVDVFKTLDDAGVFTMGQE